MTTRPGARRKSTLAGQSPIAPAPTEAEAPPAAPEPAAPTSGAESAPVEKKKHPPKTSFYPDDAIVARSRTAFRFTQGPEGFKSWSDLVNRAIDAEVRRLERKYNDGEEFPEGKPGSIPKGKPVGL